MIFPHCDQIAWCLSVLLAWLMVLLAVQIIVGVQFIAINLDWTAVVVPLQPDFPICKYHPRQMLLWCFAHHLFCLFLLLPHLPLFLFLEKFSCFCSCTASLCLPASCVSLSLFNVSVLVLWAKLLVWAVRPLTCLVCLDVSLPLVLHAMQLFHHQNCCYCCSPVDLKMPLEAQSWKSLESLQVLNFAISAFIPGTCSLNQLLKSFSFVLASSSRFMWNNTSSHLRAPASSKSSCVAVSSSTRMNDGGALSVHLPGTHPSAPSAGVVFSAAWWTNAFQSPSQMALKTGPSIFWSHIGTRHGALGEFDSQLVRLLW